VIGLAGPARRCLAVMKAIPLGITSRYETVPDPSHTAAAVGNVGVEVVGTPFLVGYLEIASHRAILPYCEEGEATVGTRIEVDHVAPALPGRPVVAEARVIAVDGRRVLFEVELRQGQRLIMKGRHGRAIVDLERFLARAAFKDRLGPGLAS
jgi:fluoroacetyl-CoA thioesterase